MRKYTFYPDRDNILTFDGPRSPNGKWGLTFKIRPNGSSESGRVIDVMWKYSSWTACRDALIAYIRSDPDFEVLRPGALAIAPGGVEYGLISKIE